MISKWEKVGEGSYKGFIFFPKPKSLNKKRNPNDSEYIDYDNSDYENEDNINNSAYSWWNPISWIF